MNIAIVGAGKVGFNIATKLQQEKHNVKVIDIDKSRIDYISQELDALGIEGNGANPLILKQVKNSDLLIAVTNNDEINILACLIAKKLNIKKKIARVNKLEYFSNSIGLSQEELGIDLIINPERLCAMEILNLIKFPEAIETLEFAGGKSQLVGFKLKDKSHLAGKTIIDFKEDPLINSIRFVAISREKEFVIPRGKSKIEANDTVYIMGKVENIPAIISWLGIESKPCQRVIIGGGSKTSLYLAQALEQENIEVKIVEQDKEKAETLSTTLKKTLVLQGNITDSQLLQNIGIKDSDYFLSLTNDDETNILACVLAKENGAQKVIPLIRKHEYATIVSSITKIDIPVGTRLSAINEVLKFLRKGEVGSVSELREIEAEVLEMTVSPNSKIAGKTIRELSIPVEAIIGIIIRGDEVLIATGNLSLEVNDKVIIFAKFSGVKEVEKMFTIKNSLTSFLS